MELEQSEENLRCCICLDTYKSPVSIPCGHTLCLQCVMDYWDTMATAMCPMCKKTYKKRPDLRVNQTMRDIVDCFSRSKAEQDAVQEKCCAEMVQLASRTDIVPCDVCHGKRLPAVRSCLECHASYCETHAVSHLRAPVLRSHWLTDPVTFNMKAVCRKHKLPLQNFCKKDQAPVCSKCLEKDHKGHKIVTVDEECKRIKNDLMSTNNVFERRIESRQMKVEEIRDSVQLSMENTERVLASSREACAAIIQAVETVQSELEVELVAKQKAAEQRAHKLLDELTREIGDLQRRASELQHLWHSSSDLHLLQCFVSLDAHPKPKDWTKVRAETNTCKGAARRAVSKLVDICKDIERKLSVEEADRIRQYASDITLDPRTASGWLILSKDNKKVSVQTKRSTTAPDSLTFDSCVCVLAKQSFTSEQHYWEVQVGDKTDWDLGVAKESINRKGAITVRPDFGYWAICRRKGGQLTACTGPSTLLGLHKPPQRVGILLDYEEGVVSFYDAEAKTHIYTYSDCAFSEALYPYFNPCVHDNGKNTAPLIICDVKQPTCPRGETCI